MQDIYLDYSATTPLRQEALAAMLPWLRDKHGNASSVHRHGRQARQAVEQARAHVAALLNADPRDIVFTSGGTEANNLAVIGAALAQDKPGQRKNLVVSAVEHPSVLEAARFLEEYHGIECRLAPVNAEGRASLAAVIEQTDAGTVLVAVMHGNNETGALQPVEEIGAWCAARAIHFHCDAVQSAGKVSLNTAQLSVDSLAVSAHKIHGPKGVGALFIRRGAKLLARALGGPQERGRRAGTEPVAVIAGFGEACRLAVEDLEAEAARLRYLRDTLERGLLDAVPGARRNGPCQERLPHIVNLAFPGYEGDQVLYYLDSEGIAVSTGSACSSGDVDASHVLLAMGQSHAEARRAVRFSVGRGLSDAALQQVIRIIAAWMNPDGDSGTSG